MKQIVRIIALISASPWAMAGDIVAPPLALDKVVFNLSAKQWVTTQKAELKVSINVTLNNADLIKARAEIMNSLNKIAKGEWHLVEFDRSQDSSGLEKLSVLAQVRVEQTALTDIYQHAKSVSVPGAKYEISSIEFKPGLDEIQAARATIREQLYQQVQDEILRLNKVYPSQNYSVNNLVFLEGENPLNPPRAYQAKEMNTMAMAQAAPVSLTISNELILTAVVEVASHRKAMVEIGTISKPGN